MDLTIVTCLYNIRKKEATDEYSPVAFHRYLELGRFVLGINLPMIIYTDSDEVVDFVNAERADKADKTSVVVLPMEETFFYQDLEHLKQRMEEFKISNLNAVKDTPLYILLNNNKFDFLERSITQNPFGSEYFLWMDFGIRHCAEEVDRSIIEDDWLPLMKEHDELIHHLRIHTVTKSPSTPWRDYFNVIYHHIAGGLFGGKAHAVAEYIDLYKEQWRTIIHDEGWWQLDEAVMTILTETHPEKFRFWYGDYDGLLTNFVKTRRSYYLVFQTAQRYLDARDYTRSERVLATMDDTWDESTNESRTYLAKRICNDFYRWGGRFSDALRKWLLDDDWRRKIQRDWLDAQVGNLRYYRGCEAMSFWAKWSLDSNQDSINRWNEFKTRGGGERIWVSIGDTELSGLTLERNGLHAGDELPFDDIAVSPDQILKLFRAQFQDFYRDDHTNKYGISFTHLKERPHVENIEMLERQIRRLYDYLECPSRPVVFFHTTESFITRSFTDEEARRYDSDLVSWCEFMERNFPGLDFCVLHLSTNRGFNRVHRRILPFVFWTTAEHVSSLTPDKPQEIFDTYRNAISEWIQKM